MNREEMKYNVRKRWVFFGLPFTFTVYHIGEDLLTIDTGFFKLEQNDCYMYKITDAKLTRTLMERVFGLGTVTCYTGDTTDKVIEIKHIKDSEEIKDYIIKADKRRSNFYNYYNNKKWGEAGSYDLCLNRSKLGFDGTVEAIVEFIELRKRMQKEQADK